MVFRFLAEAGCMRCPHALWKCCQENIVDSSPKDMMLYAGSLKLSCPNFGLIEVRMLPLGVAPGHPHLWRHFLKFYFEKMKIA